jgi:hypothetical protein
MKNSLVFLAAIGIFVLLGRSAPADPIGIVVDRDGDGYVVTVNAEGANIHFGYSEHCASDKPCYSIDAGQGAVGIPASATGCDVKGGGENVTGIQCPVDGVGSIQFKLVNGGTWSAYQGGGGLHTGTPCSPARIIVTTGNEANSINAWDGCHEVINCNTVSGGFAAVEADSIDDIHGKCASVIKH